MGKETFNYTYSASEQSEIKRIREKYAHAVKGSEELDKLEQLRRLDKSATRPGTVMALIVGIIGALIFGIGMCCVMVFDKSMFIPGIIIGIVGLVGIICAYPIYSSITKRRREKLADEILRLTDELSK